MKFRISSIVFALALYLPFETIILKYLPVPDTVYSWLRLGIESVIYVLFTLLLLNNFSKGKFLNKTLLDIPFIAFVVYALFTMIVNHAPVGDSLVDLRGLLKYSLLYFILANIDVHTSSLRKFYSAFLIVALIQGLIAAQQHFMGISQFWYPRASAVEIAGKATANFKLLNTSWSGGREQGAAIGTFGDTVPLGNFMVVSITIIAALFIGYIKIKPYRMLLLIITMLSVLFALFCTYSRGSVLVGFLGIPLVFLFSRQLYKLYPVALAGTFILAAFIAYTAIAPKPKQTYYNPKQVYTDPVSNFMNAFTSSYAEKTLDNSRGYVIATILPGLINTIPLIGYGPAMENSLTLVCNTVLGEGNFHADNVMVIADVYWLALLACYGFIGLGLILIIMGYLFYGGYIVFTKTPHAEYKIVGLILIVIILVNVPYMFIIRSLIFRPFAFYFWFFAGLMASEYRRIIAEQKKSTSLLENKQEVPIKKPVAI